MDSSYNFNFYNDYSNVETSNHINNNTSTIRRKPLQQQLLCSSEFYDSPNYQDIKLNKFYSFNSSPSYNQLYKYKYDCKKEDIYLKEYRNRPILNDKMASVMIDEIPKQPLTADELKSAGDQYPAVLNDKINTRNVKPDNGNGESPWRYDFSLLRKQFDLPNNTNLDEHTYKRNFRSDELSDYTYRQTDNNPVTVKGYSNREKYNYRIRSLSIDSKDFDDYDSKSENKVNTFYRPNNEISSTSNTHVRNQSTKNHRMHSNSPRCLIYNSQSPKRLQSINRTHSSNSPVRSYRANEYRRAKTASPSPLARRKVTSNNEMNKPQPKYPQPLYRNSKSATRKISSIAPLSSTTESYKPLLRADNTVKPKLQAARQKEKSDDEDSLDDDDNFSDVSENDDYYSSTESENDYKANIYNATSPATPDKLTNICAEVAKPAPISYLSPSLFPNVPPYLIFATCTEKGPEVPPELLRILKWRMGRTMPRIVRHTLINSGHRLLKSTNDWMGAWGKHMKSPYFRAIRPYQKINHLPGSFKIGRKDSCWKSLQKKVRRYGDHEFGFMPKTYIIPKDLHLLREMWPQYEQRNLKWIIKPPAAARGTGVHVVNQWGQIPKKKPLIVQKYIERPLLINGSKFDLRLYVLVTSINPLRIYIYNDGLARFASVKYSGRAETLNDRCMHLTNYSINKNSSNYTKNSNVHACHGHKWSLKTLFEYLKERKVNTKALWGVIRNLVVRTVLAGETGMNNMIKLNIQSKYSCYELFGFDILLDSDLVPWLLEVNISPSLHSDAAIDVHVKGPLIQAVLNTALYHIPPKLSEEQIQKISEEQGIDGPLCYDKRLYINYLSPIEKIKQLQFSKIDERDKYLNEILENLTPDDVRCLIRSEDELDRSSPLERIFPSTKTYKLLEYMDAPRYYNRLLDAWETKYANNREEGRKLLQKLCDKKIHLEITAPPIKRASNVENLILQGKISASSVVTTSSTLDTYVSESNAGSSNLPTDVTSMSLMSSASTSDDIKNYASH